MSPGDPFMDPRDLKYHLSLNSREVKREGETPSQHSWAQPSGGLSPNQTAGLVRLCGGGDASAPHTMPLPSAFQWTSEFKLHLA